MNTIPPFIQQIIGVLVRAAVVAIASYLAGRTDIQLSDDQIGSIITYLVPVVGMLAWSLYQKHRGRIKLLVAAASPHVLTEHEVEAIVNDPAKPNPSVNTPKDSVPS